jgi:hypothetical protein
MLGYAFSALLAVCVAVQFLVIPIFHYFNDPKGLRRFPTLDRFAGFTNLSFMIEAHRGFRSKKLQILHKTHPVIRTGPNSLSYGDAQAIKVCSNPAFDLENTNKDRISTVTTHDV